MEINDEEYDSGVDENSTKNNIAWKAVFKELSVLDSIEKEGSFHVTAKQLSKYGKRQPRLMAKIESVYNLPKIFEDNNLCILPDGNRGDYIIGHFDAFQEVEFNPTKLNKEYVDIDRSYDTLNPLNIQREPSAILAAYNHQILDEIAGNPQPRLSMTNFGRAYTEPFQFTIRNNSGGEPYDISVGRSQLEMDGVFECDDCVINIEAKNGLKTNFLIRQLYYPFRYLERQTDKEIYNIFMTCSAGSIYTHVFHVTDVGDYNSMELTESRRFDFYEMITVSEVAELIRETSCAPDPPNIYVPQADSFQRVFDSLEIIYHNPGITDMELAYKLSVVSRQGGYYGNACYYLGLTERKKEVGNTIYNYASRTGKEILKLPYKERILAIIKQMLRHEVFNHFLKEYIEQSKPPSKKEIEEWLKENGAKMSDNGTPGRRSGTISSWIAWVMSVCRAD